MTLYFAVILLLFLLTNDTPGPVDYSTFEFPERPASCAKRVEQPDQDVDATRDNEDDAKKSMAVADATRDNEEDAKKYWPWERNEDGSVLLSPRVQNDLLVLVLGTILSLMALEWRILSPDT